jgi:hypothetical protein
MVRSRSFLGFAFIALSLAACSGSPTHHLSAVSSTSLTTSPTLGSTTTAVTTLLFGQSPSRPLASVGTPIGPACAPTQLILEYAGEVSEPTGQHSLGLDLLNRTGTTCHLIGYPGVSLYDSANQLLPLTYRRGGDQLVTSATPQNVNLPGGSRAYVLVNQYRCDLGPKDTASVLRLIPPNTTGTLDLDLGQDQVPNLAYCGTGDPGSVLDISPVEPTAQATLTTR